MGHRAAAGEGQEDSAEDQTFQDETSTEGAHLCRCKATWLCLCLYTHCILSLRVHTHFGVLYEQVYIFTIYVRVKTCKYVDIVCVDVFHLLFAFCLCGQAHLCAYILIFLLYSSDAHLRFQMVSGHLGLFSLFLSLSFPLVIPPVSLRWKRSPLTLTM